MTSGTVKIHVRKPRRRRRCLTVRNALTVASHFNIIWRESGCSLLCSGYLYLIPFCLIPVPSSNALGSHGNSDEKWLSHQIATGTYKRCPKCREAVSKSEGCNAIKCRCGIVFCWKCGHDVDPNGCDCLKTLPSGTTFSRCHVRVYVLASGHSPWCIRNSCRPRVQVNSHSRNPGHMAHTLFHSDLQLRHDGFLRP
jgi:hypothetical protein